MSVDIAEIEALKKAFGEALRTIPISATERMLGHLLGGGFGGHNCAVVFGRA